MTASGHEREARDLSYAPWSAAEVYGRTLLGRLDARWLSSPAARRVMVGLFLLVLLIPSIQFTIKLHTPSEGAAWREPRTRSALGRWLADARAFRAGDDPYGFGHWFPNPPLVLLGLAPLSAMPLWLAGALWSLAKIAATVAGIGLLARSVGPWPRGAPPGVTAMAVLMSLRAVIGDIQHGNINLFVFFEIALGWSWFVRGHDFRAGVMFALATACKVTPALLIVYLAYKRSARGAAGAAVGLVVFLLVVPALVVGWGKNLDMLRAWSDMLIRPHVVDGYVAVEVDNQSMPAVVTRWIDAAGISPLEHSDVHRSFEAGMEDLARPAKPAGKWILLGAKAMILALLAFLCRVRLTDRRDGRWLLELGLVVIAMLMLSERTWKHHLVTLPIAYLGMWTMLVVVDWGRILTGIWVGGLVAQWVILQGTTQGLIGRELADDLLERGVVFCGLLVCFLQCALMLRASGRPVTERVLPPRSPNSSELRVL